jgi:uncharacterized membrane protein
MVFSKPSCDLAARDRIYLALTISVSLSLLLSSTLVSNALLGWDIHEEFRIFLDVARTGIWHPEIESSYNSCLSISILPAILAVVSTLDGIVIFKLVFPVLFSMVPILLYRVSRKVLPPEGAFLSVFLFMSYPVFYQELISLARQEVAELLIVLLVLLSFCAKPSMRRSMTIAELLLLIGLVTAHYSTTLIYLVVLCFTFLMSRISSRAMPLKGLQIVLLSAIIAFCWQMFIASTIVLTYSTNFFSHVVRGLAEDFFNPNARSGIVLQAVGGTETVLTETNRVVQWLVQLSLLLGFFSMVIKRKSSIAERRMFGLVTSGLALIAAAAILPYFAGGFGLGREYHIALLFVSVSFVYGVNALNLGLASIRRLVSQRLSPMHLTALKNRGPHLAATILFLYFLFISGWVYAISMEKPISFLLDYERMASSPDLSMREYYYSYFTLPRDIASARWLSSHFVSSDAVCADFDSRNHVLNSFGGFLRGGPELPSQCDFTNSHIYLSTMNTLGGIGFGPNERYVLYIWSVSSISLKLAGKDRIYSSDTSTIYS